MGNTPNPVVTQDEFQNANETLSAILMASTVPGGIGVTPATLDEDQRVIVLTVPVPGDETAEVPVAIVIDARKAGDSTLFNRLTPLPEGTQAVLEDDESAEVV